MAYGNKKILAIIQARGGSKSIPKKNIYPLAGKPLIAWTIEAAKNAKLVNRVIVSTDDEEIALVSKKYGAEVPFVRPAEFATDEAKSIGLLRHALEWLKEHENYEPDAVVQLKPTNPLRTAGHIDAAIESFFASSGIDSLLTVYKATVHPYKTWKFNNNFITPFISENISGMKEASKMPKQMLPEVFATNSCVNVINPNTILYKNSSIGNLIKGFIMKQEDSLDINGAFDFELAEFLMAKRKQNG